jgi:nucleoside-diphosphate-sugar epimerase
MRILITGAAGFIGSSLAEALVKAGHEVRGIDCFTDNYARSIKMANLKELLPQPAFSFIEGDLLTTPLMPLFANIDVCYHQAAQPGVRSSWGGTFDIYLKNNILATQRMLEYLKDHPLSKFVFASTSSVYGDCPLPMHEGQQLRPISPYGVTKLAAENLCYLYHKNFNLPFTAFRYFTVYGPRQRPDMAFHKFIRALFLGEEIQVYGDGLQTRDFTYIGDVLAANLAVLSHATEGEVFNLGGGSRVSVREVISILEEITGRKARIRYTPRQKGDSRHTFADIKKAQELLDYHPCFTIIDGLRKQVEWVKQILQEGLA